VRWRIAANKNQAMAVRAMAEIVKEYPNAKLLLAGNGPEMKILSSWQKA
jgi:glycosyltransferase involved in cell wall biosynthesis